MGAGISPMSLFLIRSLSPGAGPGGDASLAPATAGLARQLLLAEVNEGLLRLAGVAEYHRSLTLLHAGHAALDARPAAELVDAERRGGLELAAGHAADEALPRGGRDARRRRSRRSLPHEALLAHLPAGPGELGAGELGDRLDLMAHGAR